MISDPPTSQLKVVDYTGKICKSAESYGYFYKTELPLTVDKNFEECYYWMNEDFAAAVENVGKEFTMKNAYYLTSAVIKAWCLDDYENEDGELVAREDDDIVGPPFIDYKLPVSLWRSAYQWDYPGLANCMTFNENLQ